MVVVVFRVRDGKDCGSDGGERGIQLPFERVGGGSAFIVVRVGEGGGALCSNGAHG